MLPKLNALIVDDNDEMRDIAYFTALALGLLPTLASSAKEGLIYLQKVGGFDLVLSDFDMPEMTGLELLQAVRANEKLQHLPFIIATGESSQDRFKLCHDAGASGYLVKPYTTEQLRAEIERMLRSLRD